MQCPASVGECILTTCTSYLTLRNNLEGTMSYERVEQDYNVPTNGNELPTYDDLAAQAGPNSRFGRWRGWIEKRAAERYADITAEERTRRRERGWGHDGDAGASAQFPVPEQLRPPHLYIQTNGITVAPLMPQQVSPPLPPLPLVSQRLAPSHLKLNHFGSRFLPHTTSRIRCLLPLASDSLLLIGHDGGLSVLNMFPRETTEDGVGVPMFKGPDEAQIKQIWVGETVYQMDVLEVENIGSGTPQGVVLALVGRDTDLGGQESPQSIRMYNLASLSSLAKWAISQPNTRPVDLNFNQQWHVQQSPPKKLRPQSGILARGLKSLIDLPAPAPTPTPIDRSSSRGLFSPTTTSGGSPIDSWDIVEGLPLRWATDFVPLASAQSRLSGASIISYDIWNNNARKGRGGQLLAIAAKTMIHLYEAPKGERAFQFVKEFYTPMQPRKIAFVQQSVHDIPSHKRSDSNSTLRAPGKNPSSSDCIDYGPHLSIFVIFDKKAGWIRLADAAVGEIELYEVPEGPTPLHSLQTHNPHHPHREPHSTTLSAHPARRSRFIPELSAPKWLAPALCEVPVPGHPGALKQLHLLTYGRTTHILPSPLPHNLGSRPPLRILAWGSTPTQIATRCCLVDGADLRDDASVHTFLQIVAFGETGVEVQEISLSFLSTGKGKERLEEPTRAFYDLGGDVGYLCPGGRWDRSLEQFHRRPGLSRTYSTASTMTYDSSDMRDESSKEEGMYGWFRKGTEDWRIFWVGGTSGANDSVVNIDAA
ncbi:hypothetical protein BDN72DRAFT_887404 [Pluteus cervinus]|uniref:Uncharacterized protein n=1 Tax=Pluteus cervinus TaxID=181527 RepID=A0ACD3B344_9AGAR|nr:hypothetical protein BDN72DRAFT_887404 [Pluteus cervinus]